MRARLLLASVLTLTLLTCIIPALVWSNTNDNANAPSNILDVPYSEQENSYFCGPAVVQMALGYISGESVAQGTLASEMWTTASDGTKPGMLSTPFTTRGYTKVQGPLGMSLDMALSRIKAENSRGHLTIITILFDDIVGIQTGVDPYIGPYTLYNLHLVVVTGYNSSGIFVNDPWSVHWYQPHGRQPGKNSFISNSMLAKLSWNEVWEVPYPASPTYSVEIEVILEVRLGIAENMPYSSKVFVDGTEQGFLKNREARHFKFVTGTAHTVSVDQYVSGTTGTRYSCPQYSLLVDSAKRHTFEYRTQYYVELVSSYGTPTGSSWYDAGSTALLTVQPTEVSMKGPLGTIGGKALLDHWADEEGHIICDGISPGYCRVLVASPKTVTAVWREDLTYFGLALLMGLFLVVFASILLMRWKKKGHAVRADSAMSAIEFCEGKPPAPLPAPKAPSASLKFCRYCGAKIARDSKFCEECGAKLT
jgi:hypothetical protein